MLEVRSPLLAIRSPFGSSRAALSGAVARVVAYILIGQSNMVGRAAQDGGPNHPAGVLMPGRGGGSDGALIAPTNPLQHHDPVSGQMGLDVQFARDWTAANPADTLILIPGAMGGTGFSDDRWNVGDDLYADVVARANAFFTANPGVILGGFAWHQGEKEMGEDADAAIYAAALDAMITGLRTDIIAASPATPFVLGQVLESYYNFNFQRQAIQDVIDATPDRVANTAVASSAGLVDKGDALHFDAASLRTLGSRYVAAFAVAEAAVARRPGAPTGLWSTSDYVNAYLDWDAPADLGNPLVTSYSVERSLAGAGVWSEVGTATAPATSYVDGTVAPATAYDYRVSAVNTAEAGAYSGTTTTTTAAAPAPLAVEAFAHGENGTDTNPTGIYSFTALATAPGLVVAAVTIRGTNTVGASAIRIAGVAATVIHTATASATHITVIAVAEIGVSTATVEVDTTGNVLRCGVAVWSVGPGDMAGVTVVSTTMTNPADPPATTLTVSPTSIADGLILAHVTFITGGTVSWSSPLVARLARTSVESTIYHAAADYASGAVASVPVTTTTSGSFTVGLLVGIAVGPL